MSNTLQLKSPAKINLFLLLFEKRSDDFHELMTLFQLIDLCDEIEITLTQTNDISIDNPKVNCPLEEDLCYRAAILLKQYANVQTGAHIAVNKRIPQGGGLAGGSSNAATVLVGLNQLWQLNLPCRILLKLALKLGSDVPVFVYGKSTLASGRGEIFLPTDNKMLVNNKNIIVINPNVAVSTKEIFSAKQLTKRSQALTMCDLNTVRFVNDFTATVFDKYPNIAAIVNQLHDILPLHLTGTGSSLYSVLDDDKKADRIVSDLQGDYQAFLTKAIAKSPLYDF